MDGWMREGERGWGGDIEGEWRVEEVGGGGGERETGHGGIKWAPCVHMGHHSSSSSSRVLHWTGLEYRAAFIIFFIYIYIYIYIYIFIYRPKEGGLDRREALKLGK